MPKANQRLKVQDIGEGKKRTYTPEHMETPGMQEMAATQLARRRSYEQSGSRMRSPLRGVGDLAAEYEKRGWRDIEHEHGAAGPSMYEYHHLAEHGDNPFPLPTRWEDLPSEEQARAHAGLAAFGTSVGRLINDLGRGIDRGYHRASEMQSIPYASNFYEPEGFPRQAMTRAMPEHPEAHQAGAVALTSPKNKFSLITERGEFQMPNIIGAATAGRLAAEHGPAADIEAGWHFRNIPGDKINQVGRTIGSGGGGLHGNIRKAAFALGQGMAGTPLHEWRGMPSKSRPGGYELWGDSPKASPFASSFVDHAAPFHVADVMMAGIAFPHLSGVERSGVNVNPSGAATGSKSEQEMAIDQIPHAHAVIDHAFRSALGERGLSKIRFNQGGAWGEEQIHRTLHPEPGAKPLSYHPSKVYGWQAETMPHTSFTRRTKRGVGDLYLPD
jgi:hypothetical protein